MSIRSINKSPWWDFICRMFKKGDTCPHIELEEIVEDKPIYHPPEFPPPGETLLKEGIATIKRLSLIKQVQLLIFAFAMVCFPMILNWINIQMIRGFSNGFAVIYATFKLAEMVIDLIRELFLIRTGIHAEVSFIEKEVARYAKFSKPTTYKHPAEKVLVKDLTNAAGSINRIIEWGFQSFSWTVGQIISSIILLLSTDLAWYDSIGFGLFFLVYKFVLMPIQRKMTKRMEKHNKKYNRCHNLMSFRSTEFQNKESQADEFSGILNDPVAYDGKIVPLYSYTHRSVDLTMIVILYIYAFFLPNDIAFATKLILISAISTAISNIASFGNQYYRYCNNYEKYYKVFRDKDLKYDEYVAPKDLPETLNIVDVKVRRGDYLISCEKNISIQQGNQILIKGPSGSGKSSFLDAVMGYIPGIVLENGENIRAYSHQIVCHLQNAQSITLSSICIKDVFRSDDINAIREVLDLFFKKEELDLVLKNISADKPYSTFIEGKMSGGQKTRFFLASTLFKAIQKKAKIVFLDEPEQGQDPDLQIDSFRELKDFAEKYGLTSVFITHMREEPLQETGIEFHQRLHFKEGGLIDII